MKYFTAALFLLPISTLFAEEAGKLTIPIAQQGDINTMRPARGMLMTEVEKQFGMPTTVVGPIGQPPITRWIYENYTVIFEHEHVVHTVLKMKLPESEMPVEYPAETQSTAPETTTAPVQ